MPSFSVPEQNDALCNMIDAGWNAVAFVYIQCTKAWPFNNHKIFPGTWRILPVTIFRKDNASSPIIYCSPLVETEAHKCNKNDVFAGTATPAHRVWKVN